MAWTYFPVSAGDPVRAVEWNELRAAAIERGITVGDVPSEKSPGNSIRIGDITYLRSSIENRGIEYRDPNATLSVWTKATLLTAAIGQNNWTDPGAAEGDPVRAIHFNEIYLALDELRWLKQKDIGYANEDGENKTGLGAPDPGFDEAWADAKIAYAGDAWGDVVIEYAGFNGRWTGADWALIQHWLIRDCTYTIDEQRQVDFWAGFVSQAILDAKLKVWLDKEGTFTPPMSVDCHEQANFGGAAISFGTSGDQGWELLDIAIPADLAVLHFSFRTDPEAPSDAEIDDYKPAGVGNLWYRFELAKIPAETGIHLQHQFAHQT